MTRITVVGGAGYVGAAYSVALAELGHDVIGLDLDAGKIAMLSAGKTPIFEAGLEERLQRSLLTGRLRFTTSHADAMPDADFIFICVGTPPDSSGRAETSHVVAATREIACNCTGHTIIVNKSTMPIGSVERVAEMIQEHALDGVTFSVVSNPEFLREGTALHDIFHPDRIVIGSFDAAAAARVRDLYVGIDAPVLITDPRSAEMIKYASNAFLATKISFINEVALICERLGVDIAAVSRGMGLDQRIGGHFLQAGAGFGGSCFPKDVRALSCMARDAGLNPNLLEAVIEINAAMRIHVVDRLTDHLGVLAGKRVGVLGLAYKPETNDTRESPAFEVIRLLLDAGATVAATDPVARPATRAGLAEVAIVDDPYGAAMGADAIVVMTDWSLYRTLDLEHVANAMRGQLVVDARGSLEAQAVEAAGLVYVGIGRGHSAARSAPAAAPWSTPVRISTAATTFSMAAD